MKIKKIFSVRDKCCARDKKNYFITIILPIQHNVSPLILNCITKIMVITIFPISSINDTVVNTVLDEQ